MPATLRPRQSGAALDWFGQAAGQGLLAAEDGVRTRLLAAAPAMPWLWIGVDGAAPPALEGRSRGVVLRRTPRGFAGQVRCALPLPFPRESFGLVLVQHALDDGIPPDALLADCERVLAPGGTLWLAALNPWSAYWMHWARTGLRARGAARWQLALRRAGFAGDAVSLQWFGAHWNARQGGDAGVGAGDRLRAAIGFTVSKRVRALIPPAPVVRLGWQPAPRAVALPTRRVDGREATDEDPGARR